MSCYYERIDSAVRANVSITTPQIAPPPSVPVTSFERAWSSRGLEVRDALPLGGTYGELKDAWGGKLQESGKEIDHIPAWNATWEPERLGLAIVVDRRDHRSMDSTGSSDKAKALHDDQYWRMGASGIAGHQSVVNETIAEYQTKHGDKYDEHLRQMWERGEQLGKL